MKGNAVDEHFLYTLEGGISIKAGNDTLTLEAEELAIIPPGDWELTFHQAGHIYQLMTADESVAQAAHNAEHYQDGAPEVAIPEPGPEPNQGYQLRRYSTRDAFAQGGLVHAFRTRKLMMVPYPRFLEPRDETALSPHAHDDFEQGSIGLEGEWVHHLRTPWTPDKREWRDDIHLSAGSPSVLIIPAGIIHTSQGVAGEGMRLIDVFSPPRKDFAEKGWVDNAEDYPAA